MQSQRIDYTSTNDDDIRGSLEAISPFHNGDRVVESVMQRPEESLRYRTEAVRHSVEDLLYYADTNIHWMITGGNELGVGDVLPKITEWIKDAVVGPPERGTFAISTNIVLQPINTPQADTLGNTFDWDFDDGVDTGKLTVGNKLQAAEGGDILSLEIAYSNDPNILTIEKFDTTPATLKIQRVRITVSKDGTKSMTDLNTAMMGDSDITDRFDLDWTGNWNSTEIDEAGSIPTEQIYTFSEKPFEREMHLIGNGALVNFFGAPGVNDINKLKEGDTLAIYFDYLVDPDDFLEGAGAKGGRRQANVTNSKVATLQLVNLGSYPDRTPGAIPICKRIGDGLFFVDGTVIKDSFTGADPPVYFGEHGYTLARYAASTGAAEIGVAANASGGVSNAQWTITATDLQTNLEAAQLVLNNKGSLNEDETVTGNWAFNTMSPTLYYIASINDGAVVCSAAQMYRSLTTGLQITDSTQATAKGICLEATAVFNAPGKTINDLTGRRLTVTCTAGIMHDLYGCDTEVIINGGTLNNVYGSNSSVDINENVGGDVYGVNDLIDVVTAKTVAGDLYGHKTTVTLTGAVTGTSYGWYLSTTGTDYGIYQRGDGYNIFEGATTIGSTEDPTTYSTTLMVGKTSAQGITADFQRTYVPLYVNSVSNGVNVNGLLIDANLNYALGNIMGSYTASRTSLVVQDGDVGTCCGSKTSVTLNAAAFASSVAAHASLYTYLNINAAATVAGTFSAHRIESIGDNVTYGIWQTHSGLNGLNRLESWTSVGAAVDPDIALRIGNALFTAGGFGGFATGLPVHLMDGTATIDVTNISSFCADGGGGGFTIATITGGRTGQWLAIFVINTNVVLSKGGNINFTQADFPMPPGEGALLLCDGTTWNLVAKT